MVTPSHDVRVKSLFPKITYQKIKGTKDDPILVDKMNIKKLKVARDGKKFICFRWGRLDGNSPEGCDAINLRCNTCRKMGHLTTESVLVNPGAAQLQMKMPTRKSAI